MEIVERRFPVVEIFGPTIQAEGPEVGTRAHFVRFGGCDFRCSWCDSGHAVLPENVRLLRRLTAQEIVWKVRALDDKSHAPLVILSGGNPLLYDLTDVVNWLHDAGFLVSVETQGTQWKDWINAVDQVVVSPKPPSSGMASEHALSTLEKFLDKTVAPRVALKVPCFDLRDITWVADLPGLFPNLPLFLSVVTLTGGLDGKYAGGVVDTPADLINRYAQIISMVDAFPTLSDARVFPQVHYLVWGTEKGH